MTASPVGPRNDGGRAVDGPPRWLVWVRAGAAVAAIAVVVVAAVLLRRGRGPTSAARPQLSAGDKAATAAAGSLSDTRAAVAQPAVVPDGPLGTLGSGPPREGEPAPDFALRDVHGNRVQLSALQGKTVVVNFWATWCGPCMQEFPELQKAALAAGPDVVVLALDQAEPVGDVTAFRDHYGATFDILMDGENAVADGYKFSGIPDTIFIDRAGIVRHLSLGPLSAGTFTYWITKTAEAR